MNEQCAQMNTMLTSEWEQMSLGERLQFAIDGMGITKAEFSRRTKTVYRSLLQYLGDQRGPSCESLERISMATDIDMNWLLTGRGSPWRLCVQEDRAVYRSDPAVDPRLLQVRLWVAIWWEFAGEAERAWFMVQMRRAFPEFGEWLDQQSEGE